MYLKGRKKSRKGKKIEWLQEIEGNLRGVPGARASCRENISKYDDKCSCSMK